MSIKNSILYKMLVASSLCVFSNADSYYTDTFEHCAFVLLIYDMFRLVFGHQHEEIKSTYKKYTKTEASAFNNDVLNT